jgi:hypothetical protein
MRITVTKLEEAAYGAAMLGISLNKEQPVENMGPVALKLSQASAGSHRKFLRQIGLWWYLLLPRHVWAEFDTYKIGVVRNSGSTMHNIHKRPFAQEDFVRPINGIILSTLNRLWFEFKAGDLSLHELKDHLPEGYLQASVISMNYEGLRTMYIDRKNHRMPEWREMLTRMLDQVSHPEFIVPKEKKCEQS